MASFGSLPSNMTNAAIPMGKFVPFRMEVDESSRIVRTESHGFWTLAQAEDYIAALALSVEEARRRFERVRVLADRRDSSIQSDAVVDRLVETHARLFLERDRFAMVVETSLAKVHSRRHFKHLGSQAFLSYSAAELWLTAWP